MKNLSFNQMSSLSGGVGSAECFFAPTLLVLSFGGGIFNSYGIYLAGKRAVQCWES